MTTGKPHDIRRGIPAILLSAAITAAAGVSMAEEKTPAQSSHDFSFYKNLTLFNTIARQLEQNAVDTIRTDEAFREAIDAMLNTIDPYTEYFDSSQKEDLMKLSTGEYGGIGSFIVEMNGNTYISSPMEGSPAQKAGMKGGDLIIQVDSVMTRGMTSDKVTKHLKGQPGTPLTVTVQRPYVTDSILTFNLTRAKVQEPSVPYYGVVNGSTGYIRLNRYIDKSPQEVKEALLAFKADPRVKNVVLDLRGNGGGLVESAVEIVGFFVPKGTEVLRTRGRLRSEERTLKTTKSPIMPDIPLAVLIDGGSASASEITAGALQDLDRAVLVGSLSYGKGLVQGTFELPFDGALKMTVAKYYIPSGRLIQALDYSRRNPDGSVARTPDSLTNLYHTRAGRPVRDGGGLKPDSTVEWERVSPLVYRMMTDHHIFNYSVKYAAMHPEAVNPSTFSITDADFDEFVAGIDSSAVKSDRTSLDILDNLRLATELDKQTSPDVKAHLDSLASLLKPDVRRDLYRQKEALTQYLNEEISSRYHSEAGRVEASLKDDVGLKKALDILNDPKLYNKILGKKK